jgi:hypothetical protein
VLVLAAVVGAALLITAALALPRQINGIDPAAAAGWWSDYAEHVTVLAKAGYSPPVAGPAGGSWQRCAARSGCTSASWHPWYCTTTPEAGAEVAVALGVLIGAGFAVAVWRTTPDPQTAAERPPPASTPRQRGSHDTASP